MESGILLRFFFVTQGSFFCCRLEVVRGVAFTFQRKKCKSEVEVYWRSNQGAKGFCEKKIFEL